MNFSERWEEVYLNKKTKAVYDDWLDKYKYILNNCKSCVLDLGCGIGNNTLYLKERGFDVLACDYSKNALKILESEIKGVKTLLHDISKPFDFEDNSFELIIADLCLHYFDTETTKNVLREIKRILVPNGYLLARVNSINDVNHGAGQGEKIEENFYFVNGYNKRFFDEKIAKDFFSIIGDAEVKEADLNRLKKPKKLIEICVKNNKI